MVLLSSANVCNNVTESPRITVETFPVHFQCYLQQSNVNAETKLLPTSESKPFGDKTTPLAFVITL